MEALTDVRHEIEQLRDSWQVRVIKGARGSSRAVVLSIIAENFDGAILTICELVWPGFRSLRCGYESAGRIDKSGKVVADYRTPYGATRKDQEVYPSDIAYRDDMRRLADRLKLSDQERLEFFTCVRRWIVADRRLDPTMNPADPDAKRLLN